ncbi:DUF2852 domain-containing protein [Lutibaculum baratangense]
MVLGFVTFWPLGIAMLAWICWGEQMVEWWERNRSGFTTARMTRPFTASASTGNEAFEDYRRGELERLERERRRLEDEAHEFEVYMRELRKARDREEFDRFMRERRERSRGAQGEVSTAVESRGAHAY